MKYIDEYTKINQTKWDQVIEPDIQQYSTPWCHLDINQIKAYLNGDIETLPDDMNWLYPKSLFQHVQGKQVLGLASGGGQQSVVFSLLGAHVTVADVSERQLALDQQAADHFGYDTQLVHTDMRDLSFAAHNTFDIVYQPVSICFVPDVLLVYREAFRVLKPGGLYEVGHCNPATYPTCFDGDKNGWDGVGYRIAEPYICGPIRRDEQGNESMTAGTPTGEFRHSLSDIFNKLINTGFTIQGVFEDPRHLNPAPNVDIQKNMHAAVLEYFSILCWKPLV